ncbi:hypothetical protein [Glycomyces sp. YM15]|uniref:hypothetical protein n=1 Tax=Glycomyces sp. YM15 TaxID=2800446 RepID=UPI0019646A49|nr:hypothetical protein [Glycomyces sp. YM15]
MLHLDQPADVDAVFVSFGEVERPYLLYTPGTSRPRVMLGTLPESQADAGQEIAHWIGATAFERLALPGTTTIALAGADAIGGTHTGAVNELVGLFTGWPVTGPAAFLHAHPEAYVPLEPVELSDLTGWIRDPHRHGRVWPGPRPTGDLR